MGSAWHEVSALGRPATRWGSLLAICWLPPAVAIAMRPRRRDGGTAVADRGHTATDRPPAAPTGATRPPRRRPPTPPHSRRYRRRRQAADPPTAKPRDAGPEAARRSPAAPEPGTAPSTPQRRTGYFRRPPPPHRRRAAARRVPSGAEGHRHQAVYDGWKQYNLNCARCHGEDVLGTTIAPHLIVSLKPDGPINTKELFVQTVCAGRPAKGMPAWCALGMDPAKINEIYSYVKGRSEGKISPGPAGGASQGG